MIRRVRLAVPCTGSDLRRVSGDRDLRVLTAAVGLVVAVVRLVRAVRDA